MGLWDFLKQKAVEIAGGKGEDFKGWIILPLGNPGEEYAMTRHNMGRVLVQRWTQAHCPKPEPSRPFQTGTLYQLTDAFMALVPSTYMNLSGQVVSEAVKAGFDPARFIVIYDDKDLPLGSARFRMEGSPGGHNGMANVIACLDSDKIARLRLGIGPFQRPLHEFVLQEWTDEEWPQVEAMDEPFARFMNELAQCSQLAKLPSKINSSGFWSSDPGTKSKESSHIYSEGTA